MASGNRSSVAMSVHIRCDAAVQAGEDIRLQSVDLVHLQSRILGVIGCESGAWTVHFTCRVQSVDLEPMSSWSLDLAPTPELCRLQNGYIWVCGPIVILKAGRILTLRHLDLFLSELDLINHSPKGMNLNRRVYFRHAILGRLGFVAAVAY
jgi:hypothetical protein